MFREENAVIAWMVIFGLAFFAMLFGGISLSEKRASAARSECIASGASWVSGDCLRLQAPVNQE